MQEESDSDWDSIVEPMPQLNQGDTVKTGTDILQLEGKQYMLKMDSTNDEFEAKQAKNLLNLTENIQPHLPPSSPQLKRSNFTASIKNGNVTNSHDVPPTEGSNQLPPFVQVDIRSAEEETKVDNHCKTNPVLEPIWKPNNPFSSFTGGKEKTFKKIFEKRWMYFFDHGKFSQFEVCDETNDSCISSTTNKFDDQVHHIWTEVFASLRFVFDFIILFVLHLLRFIGRDLFQPLVLGSCLIVCDYVLKPSLTVIFNGICQPLFIFFWNITSSLVRVLEPVVEIISRFFNLLATLLRAFRLVEISSHPPVAPKVTI